MTDNNYRQYSVFISYRHADNIEQGRKWATWLHEALESYEIPPDLIGQKNLRDSVVPQSLYPVFRDEVELPADADLSTNIRRALENSTLLVVICSPRTVQSRFVADEIRYFKELGKSSNILALIIDGEPNAAHDGGKTSPTSTGDECFPQPLRFGMPTADGRLDWNTRTEPIAADVRPQGRPEQGWTTAAAYREHLEQQGHLSHNEMAQAIAEYDERLKLAKLKIIAGALGQPLGELTRRDKVFELAKARHRAKVLRRWLAVVAFLSLAAIVGGVVAWTQKQQADSAAQEALDARNRAIASKVEAEAANERTKLALTDANNQRQLAEKNEKQAKIERDIARRAREIADEFVKYLQDGLVPELEAAQKSALLPEIQMRIQRYLDETHLDPSDIAGVLERSRLFLTRATAFKEKGSYTEAVKECQSAGRLTEPYLNNPKDMGALVRLHSLSVRLMSEIIGLTGQKEQALMLLENAKDEMASVLQVQPEVGAYVVDMANIAAARGKLLLSMQRKKEAMEAYQTSVKTLEPLAKNSLLADSIFSYSEAWLELIKISDEIQPQSVPTLVDEWSQIMENYKPAEAHLAEYLNATLELGNAQIAQATNAKDWDKVMTLLERSLDVTKRLNAIKPILHYGGYIQKILTKAASLAGEKMNRKELAESLLKKLIQELTLTLGDAPGYQDLRILAFGYNELGEFYQRQGIKLKESQRAYAKALELMEKTIPMRKGPDVQRDLAAAHQRMGMIAGLLGEWKEAVMQQDKALAAALNGLKQIQALQVSGDIKTMFFMVVSTSAQCKAEALVGLFKATGDKSSLETAHKLLKETFLQATQQRPEKEPYTTDFAKQNMELMSLIDTIEKMR